MTNIWLSHGAAMFLTAMMAMVLLVHARHLLRVGPHDRLWHGAHVLMALGMIDMAVPAESLPIPATAVGGVFVGAATLAGGYTLLGPIRGTRRWSWPWLLTTVSLATMAYMVGAVVTPSDELTLAFAVWSVMDAMLWAFGILVTDSHPLDGNVKSGAPTAPFSAARPDRESARPLVLAHDGQGVTHRWQAARAISAPSESGAGTADGRIRWKIGYRRSLRVTSAVMGLGMACMLMAMQFGGPQTHSHVPDGEMPGMTVHQHD